MNPLLHAWLIAFAITIVVELCVATPLLAPSGASVPRRLGVILIAQLATHPSVWFIWPLLGLPRSGYLLIAEGFAFVAEALIYRLAFERLPWSRAVATSALANGVSLLVGMWLR